MIKRDYNSEIKDSDIDYDLLPRKEKEKPTNFYQGMVTRVIGGWLIISGFVLIYYLGQLQMALFYVPVSLLIFAEVSDIKRNPHFDQICGQKKFEFIFYLVFA
jgi:hypothetical protein